MTPVRTHTHTHTHTHTYMSFHTLSTHTHKSKPKPLKSKQLWLKLSVYFILPTSELKSYLNLSIMGVDSNIYDNNIPIIRIHKTWTQNKCHRKTIFSLWLHNKRIKRGRLFSVSQLLFLPSCVVLLPRFNILDMDRWDYLSCFEYNSLIEPIYTPKFITNMLLLCYLFLN